MRKSAMGFGLVVLLAAAAAVQGASRPAVVIPLHGRVDEFLVESFHTRWQRASSGALKLTVDVGKGKGESEAEITGGTPQVVLLDLDTEGGTLDSAVQLADAIHRLHEDGVEETAALVHKPGSAATTLLALPADTLFMAPGSRLAPLDPKAFDASAPEEATKTLLEAVDRYSSRRPRLKTLYRALVDPSLDVQAVELEGREGRPLFLTTAELRKRLSEGEESIVSTVRVAKKGAVPTLDAQRAEQIHLSSGMRETIAAAATQLGIAASHLKTLPQEGARQEAPATAKPTKATKEGREEDKAFVPPPIPDQGPVVIMPLSGIVGDGWEHSVERRLADVDKLEERPALLIFEMDTYGGKLMNAFTISNRVFDLREVRTVVYVNRKAISAGSFISVAADEIVMHRGSTMGDCQIVTQGGEAVGSEKLNTVLRADFRKFCRGKYPIALAEAMVMQNYEVYECITPDGQTEYLKGQDYNTLTPSERERYRATKRIIDSDTLLTMTDSEARRYGFSKATVEGLDQVLEHYGVAERKLVEMPMNWSESFVRTLDRIGPLLLTLGILGVIIELKTPGFGVFGLAGLALVLVFFLGKHTAGLAEVWEILLFFVGVGLLALEIFVIPGFGVAGLAGLVCMLASIVLAAQEFWVPHKEWEWEQFNWNLTELGMVCVGVFIGAVLVGKYLHKAPYLGKLVLREPSPSTAPTATSQSVSRPPSPKTAAERAKELVGRRGQAVSMLRPAGRAEFDGEPLDVVTEGDYIQPGEPIEICAVHGNRVVVRRAM